MSVICLSSLPKPQASATVGRQLHRCSYTPGGDAVDGEVVEEFLHGDAELLVVAVDGGPVRRFAALAWAADTGEDGGDDLVAQGDEADQYAGGVGWDPVAVGASDLVDEVFGAEFAQ